MTIRNSDSDDDSNAVPRSLWLKQTDVGLIGQKEEVKTQILIIMKM